MDWRNSSNLQLQQHWTSCFLSCFELPALSSLFFRHCDHGSPFLRRGQTHKFVVAPLQDSPARDSGADPRLLRSVIASRLLPDLRQSAIIQSFVRSSRTSGRNVEDTRTRERWNWREREGRSETTRRNRISIILEAEDDETSPKRMWIPRWCSKVPLVLFDPRRNCERADLFDRSIHFGELWWANDSILLISRRMERMIDGGMMMRR